MEMGSQFSPQSLEGLRRCLRPEFTGMPAEDLEQIVNTSISEMPASAADDFMKALGSLGKAVGPTLQRAAPGIAQGAATGASVGGPWGALFGAGAGLASAALSGQGRPSGPAAPAPGVTAAPSATGPPQTPVAPALPTGQGAAATLLGLLQNPTVQQALMSQVLGSSGNQQVPAASGASLPRGAINSLLMQLLANATEGLVESESISEQSYLQDESGEYLIDPASPEQQAAVVLSHLQSGAPQFQESNLSEFVETVDWIMEELDGSESQGWLEFDESAEMVRFY
jgi:hypothetical protein